MKNLFPSTIIEWNKLDSNVRCSPSYKLFRKWILDFIRPHPNSIFNVPNFLGSTYRIRLSFGLSHLREHKFLHIFRDSLNPICNCGNAIEATKHYFSTARIWRMKGSLSCKMFELLTQIPYPWTRMPSPTYSGDTLTDNTNTFLLNSVIEYITSTKRLNNHLIL